MRWAALAIVALTAGCGSAAQDFENICNAEERSGAANIEDAAEKQATIARWLTKNIRTRQARDVFESITTASSQSKLLVDEARRAGYSGPCPIADL